jgi:hypothetical protein
VSSPLPSQIVRKTRLAPLPGALRRERTQKHLHIWGYNPARSPTELIPALRDGEIPRLLDGNSEKDQCLALMLTCAGASILAPSTLGTAGGSGGNSVSNEDKIMLPPRDPDIAVQEEYEAARASDTAAVYQLFIARHGTPHLPRRRKRGWRRLAAARVLQLTGLPMAKDKIIL